METTTDPKTFVPCTFCGNKVSTLHRVTFLAIAGNKSGPFCPDTCAGEIMSKGGIYNPQIHGHRISGAPTQTSS